MDEMDEMESTVKSLAAKLTSLDLTDDEMAVLGTLLSKAAVGSDEVAGFGVVFELETTRFKGTDEELQAVVHRGIGSSVWTDMRPLSVMFKRT